MEAAETYRQQGFLVVKSLFSNQEIEALTKIVDRIHRQWLNENHAIYIAQRLVNMHSLTNSHYFAHHPSERLRFFQALASDRLTKLLAKLFGDDIYFHNTQLFFNPYQNSRLPYWHRDLQYSPLSDAELQAEQPNMLSLHIRIPLLPETGVELIPGTHQRWDTDLERDVRLELNGHKNSEALADALLIGLEPGDILIFDAQMLHRGNYQLNPARKALDLCVGKPHRYTLPFLDAGNLPTSAELNAIDNQQWYKRARAMLIEPR
ncbi:phytanoyl-CoA dioxygenase family protein [Methylomonas montana]|uniref:phytanoyl-CoA dioxygenase family protein n=1 Tax=Methylomonas montana TaxID=3058963 RepID=UPI0026584D94|nr:phytanoyl-CoA dioxygenase family protein [Methylomonas montana]WKJ91918.1 phytanoyl-CoA dioxygenase family protein [Methylomonas montana]